MTTSIATLDIASLRRAIEGRDARLLTSLYADDAELQVIDRMHPPSAPLRLQGKGAIAEFYGAICAREMTHHVEHTVVSPEQLAFTESCEYPDGMRVFCAALAELRDGKIGRQVSVQAWDE